MFKYKKNKSFLERKNMKMCPNCGNVTNIKTKVCDICKKDISNGIIDEDKSLKLLNLNDAMRKRTKYWRELMLMYSAFKLPIEVIAYY